MTRGEAGSVARTRFEQPRLAFLVRPRSARPRLGSAEADAQRTGDVARSAVHALFGDGDPSKRDFDFRRREIVAFCPADYTLGRRLPLVRNERRRRLCVETLSRLKKCGLEWPRYGEPVVERDRPRGYRVRYRSRPPEEEKKIVFTMLGNTYFAMTPRGTIFAVWIGE